MLHTPDGKDRFATNNLETGEQVGLLPLDGVEAAAGGLTFSLPALSWAVIEVEVTKN
ncbi:hypothetical protein [Planctomonas psychrotolerans]|uniref:hypothetical protein n=1 Tax=Planctomonas psychrotolerans TaxID=2528712 RepID=UPI001D0D1F26|nr:hypothetical protein [Planctomonas psychrotolerans]